MQPAKSWVLWTCELLRAAQRLFSSVGEQLGDFSLCVGVHSLGTKGLVRWVLVCVSTSDELVMVWVGSSEILGPLYASSMNTLVLM